MFRWLAQRRLAKRLEQERLLREGMEREKERNERMKTKLEDRDYIRSLPYEEQVKSCVRMMRSGDHTITMGDLGLLYGADIVEVAMMEVDHGIKGWTKNYRT